MARPLRIEFPGAIYHVTARMLGDWKRESNLLFEDDADRFRFLDRLGERVAQFEIRLYLFTLMANHFHLVVETPSANLGRFMQSLSTAYTVYFNKRHRRHGHLLDGRYKAKLVEGDEYLLALTRYVHLNPVYTRVMVRKTLRERIEYLRRYRWSSYAGYIGRRKQFEFVDSTPVLAQMKCRKCDQPRRYREYVETGLAENDDDFREAMKSSPLCIGGESFEGRIVQLYESLGKKHAQPEDVSFRRTLNPLPPAKVLNLVAEAFEVEVAALHERRRDSPVRGVAARALCRYSGVSQREVAQILEMGTGSAVSRQLKALPERLEANGRLRRIVRELEAHLQELRGGGG